jgi:O-antigen/teichoic acid export membrane protein
VLALSLPAWFLTLVLISTLEAMDRQRSAAASVVLAGAASAPLTLIVAGQWGLVGSAVAYVAAHLVLSLLLLQRVAGGVGWVVVRRGVLRPVLAGGGMGALMALVHDWPPAAVFALAMVSFGVLLVLLGAVGRQEVAALRAMLPGRREVAYG